MAIRNDYEQYYPVYLLTALLYAYLQSSTGSLWSPAKIISNNFCQLYFSCLFHWDGVPAGSPGEKDIHFRKSLLFPFYTRWYPPPNTNQICVDEVDAFVLYKNMAHKFMNIIIVTLMFMAWTACLLIYCIMVTYLLCHYVFRFPFFFFFFQLLGSKL